MTQTLAILYDAYRSLNAKKMFWFILVISVFVVVAFAFIGLNKKGVTIAFWQLDSEMINTESFPPAAFYKFLFARFGIGLWLTRFATILALISTAGIFPDLISSGSIDLLVSKPIARLRLFFTQYAAGLLFATLQVTLFTLASFLVIGLRGGVWEPGLFLAVPVVVCFFSYLFSVSVLLAMLGRSTLACLLLTLLFWFGLFAVETTESSLLMFKTMRQQGASWIDVQAQPRSEGAPAKNPSQRPVRSEAAASADTPDPAGRPRADDDANAGKDPGKVPRAIGRALLKALAGGSETEDKSGTAPSENLANAEGKKGVPRSLEFAHSVAYGVKTVLPKTTETVALLERTLIAQADIPEWLVGGTEAQRELTREMEATVRERSVWWVVGTSLGFELFVLAWAGLIFCRRDF